MPLSEVPDMMRALGFFPSEYEVANLVNEVKFEHYATTGVAATKLALPTFLRLFVNHRPALGVSVTDVERAFAALATSATHPDPLDTAALMQLLQETVEALTEDELGEILGELLGPNAALPPLLTARGFMDEVLACNPAAVSAGQSDA
jgi:hypothetical protein